MEQLRKRHISLINSIDTKFIRYLYFQLPWDERLVGIKGSRGVGKTTMLLQYIKKNYGLSDQSLYISLDDLYFSENRLIDFAEDFVGRGGEHLFIDEVHKYPDWSVEIKKIYDYFPDLKIAFTGSSLLEILNSRADLSRRALTYNMQGLSFREYLELSHGFVVKPLSLEDVIERHTEIALEISQKIKPLKYFNSYLKTGYFPFYNNNETLYYKKLEEIINLILEIELPTLRNTDISIVNKIKKLLFVVSQSVPFTPNVSAIAEKIGITRKTALMYLNYLSEAGVFSLVYKNGKGLSLLQKPDKLLMENTNYMFAVKTSEPNAGSLRETFFFNQLSRTSQLTIPDKGDFIVDGKYIFEIGGKNKDFKQIAELPDSYIAADNIEFGTGNKIPLWLFGFLY